jgi:hypothetical protein
MGTFALRTTTCEALQSCVHTDTWGAPAAHRLSAAAMHVPADWHAGTFGNGNSASHMQRACRCSQEAAQAEAR